MRIAIPTANGRLALHFGHCAEFTLIDTDDTTREILSVTAVDPPPHEPGLLPAWLAGQGAEIIIAGGMGGRAQALFSEKGIRVITGAPDDTPENVVRAFLADQLACGANACDH